MNAGDGPVIGIKAQYWILHNQSNKVQCQSMYFNYIPIGQTSVHNAGAGYFYFYFFWLGVCEISWWLAVTEVIEKLLRCSFELSNSNVWALWGTYN